MLILIFDNDYFTRLINTKLSEVLAHMQYLATLSTFDELYFVTLLKLCLQYLTSNNMSSVCIQLLFPHAYLVDNP